MSIFDDMVNFLSVSFLPVRFLNMFIAFRSLEELIRRAELTVNCDLCTMWTQLGRFGQQTAEIVNFGSKKWQFMYHLGIIWTFFQKNGRNCQIFEQKVACFKSEKNSNVLLYLFRMKYGTKRVDFWSETPYSELGRCVFTLVRTGWTRTITAPTNLPFNNTSHHQSIQP